MQLTGRGSQQYWFQGKPFPGGDRANTAGSQQYWFQGKPVPFVYVSTSTIIQHIMMMGVG